MMINLLPPKDKEELIQEENWKLVTILGTLFLIFLICFSLILFSIKTYIAGEVAVQKILFQQRQREFNNPQIQTLLTNLISFNKTLSELDNFYQSQFNLTETIEEISQTLPPGIYLNNLSLAPLSGKGKEDWQLSGNLSGFSPTRETLLKFKENLEKEDNFGEISFPPTSWVKPTNINFQVNFKIGRGRQ